MGFAALYKVQVISLVKQNIEYAIKIMAALFHWKSYLD